MKLEYCKNTIVLVLIMLLVLFSQQGNTQQSLVNTNGLELSVKTFNQNYLPGEIVPIEFELKNTGSKTLIVRNIFFVGPGYLNVFIASNSKDFKKYRNPKWGALDIRGGRPLVLKPNQSVKTQAKISYNYRRKDYRNLAPEIEQRDREKFISSSYAFPKPGVYHLKATFMASLVGEQPRMIESQPMQVVIAPPSGEDAAIWNEIKDDDEIAQFIQFGNVGTVKNEKRIEVRNKVDRLFRTHPNSRYRKTLERGLKKFEQKEEKKRKFMEKINRRQGQ